MRFQSRFLTFLFCVALVAIASRASAQERRVGLTIGYPASVGLQWQATNRFALRFDGSYSWSKNGFGGGEVDAPPAGSIVGGIVLTSVTDLVDVTHDFSDQYGSIGVTALFTLTRTDHLRTYIAPRFGLGVSRSTTTTTFIVDPSVAPFTTVPAPQSETDSSTAPTMSGSFGAAAPIGDRFSVFGEIGVAYSRSSSSSAFGSESHSSAVGLRSGIGVMMLF